MLCFDYLQLLSSVQKEEIAAGVSQGSNPAIIAEKQGISSTVTTPITIKASLHTPTGTSHLSSSDSSVAAEAVIASSSTNNNSVRNVPQVCFVLEYVHPQFDSGGPTTTTTTTQPPDAPQPTPHDLSSWDRALSTSIRRETYNLLEDVRKKLWGFAPAKLSGSTSSGVVKVHVLRDVEVPVSVGFIDGGGDNADDSSVTTTTIHTVIYLASVCPYKRLGVSEVQAKFHRPVPQDARIDSKAIINARNSLKAKMQELVADVVIAPLVTDIISRYAATKEDFEYTRGVNLSRSAMRLQNFFAPFEDQPSVERGRGIGIWVCAPLESCLAPYDLQGASPKYMSDGMPWSLECLTSELLSINSTIQLPKSFFGGVGYTYNSNNNNGIDSSSSTSLLSLRDYGVHIGVRFIYEQGMSIPTTTTPSTTKALLTNMTQRRKIRMAELLKQHGTTIEHLIQEMVDTTPSKPVAVETTSVNTSDKRITFPTPSNSSNIGAAEHDDEDDDEDIPLINLAPVVASVVPTVVVSSGVGRSEVDVLSEHEPTPPAPLPVVVPAPAPIISVKSPTQPPLELPTPPPLPQTSQQPAAFLKIKKPKVIEAKEVFKSLDDLFNVNTCIVFDAPLSAYARKNCGVQVDTAPPPLTTAEGETVKFVQLDTLCDEWLQSDILFRPQHNSSTTTKSPTSTSPLVTLSSTTTTPITAGRMDPPPLLSPPSSHFITSAPPAYDDDVSMDSIVSSTDDQLRPRRRGGKQSSSRRAPKMSVSRRDLLWKTTCVDYCCRKGYLIQHHQNDVSKTTTRRNVDGDDSGAPPRLNVLGRVHPYAVEALAKYRTRRAAWRLKRTISRQERKEAAANSLVGDDSVFHPEQYEVSSSDDDHPCEEEEAASVSLSHDAAKNPKYWIQTAYTPEQEKRNKHFKKAAFRTGGDVSAHHHHPGDNESSDPDDVLTEEDAQEMARLRAIMANRSRDQESLGFSIFPAPSLMPRSVHLGRGGGGEMAVVADLLSFPASSFAGAIQSTWPKVSNDTVTSESTCVPQVDVVLTKLGVDTPLTLPTTRRLQDLIVRGMDDDNNKQGKKDATTEYYSSHTTNIKPRIMIISDIPDNFQVDNETVFVVSYNEYASLLCSLVVASSQQHHQGVVSVSQTYSSSASVRPHNTSRQAVDTTPQALYWNAISHNNNMGIGVTEDSSEAKIVSLVRNEKKGGVSTHKLTGGRKPFVPVSARSDFDNVCDSLLHGGSAFRGAPVPPVPSARSEGEIGRLASNTREIEVGRSKRFARTVDYGDDYPDSPVGVGTGYQHSTTVLPSTTTTTLTILHDDDAEDDGPNNAVVVEHRIASNILKQSQVVLYRDLGTGSSSSLSSALYTPMVQDFDVVTMCLAKIEQVQHQHVGDMSAPSHDDAVVAFDVFSAAQVRWIRSALRAQFGGETMRKCKSLLSSACTTNTNNNTSTNNNNNNPSDVIHHRIGSKRSRSTSRGSSSSSVLADHFNFSATFPSKLLRHCPHIQHPTVVDVRLVGSGDSSKSSSFVHVEVAANISKDRWPTRIELIAPVSVPSSNSSSGNDQHHKHAMLNYSCPCTKRVGTEPSISTVTNEGDVTGEVGEVESAENIPVPDDGCPPPLPAPLLAPSPSATAIPPPRPQQTTPSNKPPCRHALMLALWYISQSIGW